MNENDRRRWLKSLFIFILVFLAFSLYLYLRRGYYNLYILNKVLGSSAVALAGITLLVGPLSKQFRSFARFMMIRRHLGLLAFGLALTHVIVSFSQQARFPFPSWYLQELMPVLFGIAGVLVWAYMAYISRDAKIRTLGVDVWENRLSIAGQLAFLAIFLHLAIMKYEGWLRWFNGQVKQTPELANPSYPPASLFVFIFMSAVILYRVINYYRKVKD